MSAAFLDMFCLAVCLLLQTNITDVISVRSRVLLSTKDDQDETYGPHVPFSYRDFFMQWFSEDLVSCRGESLDVVGSDADFAIPAPAPQVDAAIESSSRSDQRRLSGMSPNITAQVLTQHINTTA